ncbi:MAG: DUF1810 domain-containing protein [Ramlibacter sp.]
MADASFDLQRFVVAQDSVLDDVRAELRAGRKTSHWMWFVFPQLAGLGSSAMARRYAIASAAEARAYLAHPVLGARLRECCDLLLQLPGDDAHAVFGSPDDLKLRSCLTLFDSVEPRGVFAQCLRKYFGGVADAATTRLLSSPAAG